MNPSTIRQQPTALGIPNRPVEEMVIKEEEQESGIEMGSSIFSTSAVRGLSGTEPNGPWRRLRRWEGCAVLLTGIVIFITALPHVAPGICFGDAGDLQLGSALLGVMHPPGYVGYAAAGHLFCRLSFFADPAYVVNIACLGAVAFSGCLLTLLLARLGLNVLIAGSIALLITAHPTLWRSMTTPEVYAPSLALLSITVYLAVKYSRFGKLRDLCIASAVFGFLVINRVPAAFYTPGLAVALLVIEYRRSERIRAAFGRLGLAACCAIVPVVLTLGSLAVLDSRNTTYNYLDQRNDVYGEMPSVEAGIGARVSRIYWLISGEQFRRLVGTSWRQAQGKLRWLRQELYVDKTVPWIAALGLLVLGGWHLRRGNGADAWLFGGTLAGALSYLFLYRIYGQAADMLPVLFGVALLIGGALCILFSPERRRLHLLSIAIFLSCCVFTWQHANIRKNPADKADATGFLEGLEFETWPANPLVYAEWEQSRVIYYACCIVDPRTDITIVTTTPGLRAESAPPEDRPVFYAERGRTHDGWRIVPWRNIWRLEKDPEREPETDAEGT